MSSYKINGGDLYIHGTLVRSEHNSLIQLYEIVTFFRFLYDDSEVCDFSINYIHYGSNFCAISIPGYKDLSRYDRSVFDEAAFNAFRRYSVNDYGTREGHSGFAFDENGKKVARWMDVGLLRHKIPSCDIQEKAYEIFSEIEPLLKQALARALE